MHTGTMADSEGDFKGWKPVVMAGYVCPKCSGPLKYRDWESSCGGYEDQQIKCTACGHSWWVEGADS